MGETQERERVLAHFSQRYFQCNPGALSSEGEEARGQGFPSWSLKQMGTVCSHRSMSVYVEVNACTGLQACEHARVRC